ncbi:TetR/AcrR family transcriptional regulator C-terminal domain-containing protein [Streptomyces sp. NPDC089799]|uniref:TetR/AcrR family transcriptional regulator n=1 Tax=Streptomyces sp. NPDC089799 TaxID=3155066 RepID=UPI0034374E8C
MEETVRLLWGPPAGPRRGPKPALSLDRIADAGVGIADAEGLAALSMQRVAERLGKTKMSLYRYVPGRAELVALMVESAIGEPPGAAAGTPAGQGWRERLGHWARSQAAVFRQHPWLLDATLGARVMGPRELDWTEEALGALEGTGLTGAERLDAVVLLTGHVRGIAQQTRALAGPAEHPQEPEEPEEPEGPEGSDEAPEDRLASVMRRLTGDHGDRYPALTGALAEAAARPEERNQALEFGLERILDGLEALVTARSRA